MTEFIDDHLEKTRERDNADVDASVSDIARAVMGDRLVNAISRQEAVQSVIEELFRCYHIPYDVSKHARQFRDTDEQLDYYLCPYGIMRRNVILEKKWYKSSVGIMMGTLKTDGTKVLLIPNATIGYSYLDIVTGKRHIINRKTAEALEEDAICFYQPLPGHALKAADLIKFGAKQLSAGDVAAIFLSMLLPMAVGLIVPFFTTTLFGTILPLQNLTFLAVLAVFMLLYVISSFCLSVFRGVTRSRVIAKSDMAVQAALFGRLLNLPSTFFLRNISGNLSYRISMSERLCSTFVDGILITGLSALFSLAYIFQIFSFSPVLAVPAVIIAVVTIAVSLAVGSLTNRHNAKLRVEETELKGMENEFLYGIQKIRTTGSEKRIYSRWAKQYAKKARIDSNPNVLLGIRKTVMLAISLLGMLLIYSVALAAKIDTVTFFAFMTSYGMLSGALGTLTELMTSSADLKNILEMVKPVLEEATEMGERGHILTELTGGIQLEHVSFAYREGMPNVLDDFNLTINKGEYLAIVGKTGSGKSTIFRLMLGFERPQSGTIYYDGEDIRNLDIQALRRNFGVVLQNASLFTGDIFYNIVLTKPMATMDEAWAAAEKAAIADDIRALPMGMRTVITEGSGGISGGQRQRLLIARALVSDPSIILFDEATSALDNITQEKVTQSIEKLGCTRVVIAHRLSTVRNADRIVVLDKGHIVEEGTYESLMEKHGVFAGLVAHQQLEGK